MIKNLAFIVLAVVCLVFGFLFFGHGIHIAVTGSPFNGFLVFEGGSVFLGAAWVFWVYSADEKK